MPLVATFIILFCVIAAVCYFAIHDNDISKVLSGPSASTAQINHPQKCNQMAKGTYANGRKIDDNGSILDKDGKEVLVNNQRDRIYDWEYKASFGGRCVGRAWIGGQSHTIGYNAEKMLLKPGSHIAPSAWNLQNGGYGGFTWTKST